MSIVMENLAWGILLATVGAFVGGLLVLLVTRFIPGILNRLTPNIDEQRELIRGNIAVAEYFGRAVAASILGMSIVIAAALAAGMFAALN